MIVRAMMKTHPGSRSSDTLVRCVEDCLACAQSCTTCADACLGENVQGLVTCIGLNLACADLCDATARILSRQTAFDPPFARSVLQTCAEACWRCADECERHAGRHEHCRVCAEACRLCERACDELAASLG